MAFHFPRNPRKSIYGGKYTKDRYSSFVFPATCSPSFVIPATMSTSPQQWSSKCPIPGKILVLSLRFPQAFFQGGEIFLALAHSDAQVAPVVLPLVAHFTPGSCKGLSSRDLPSLLFPALLSAASHGTDPPSLSHSSISILADPEG
jgi:hypothetical protein